MKKIVSYIFSVLLSAAIGAFIMYYLFDNNYIKIKTESVEKVEKNVTITDTGIAEGIDNIFDAVVVVENYKKGKLVGIGSGFIYDEEGYIITNHHVIEKATELKVVLSNKERIQAELIGSDEFADIAVIKINKTSVTRVAKLGNSENSRVGDTVFTIGSPMSSEYSGTVTRGILSGKNRMVEVSISSTTNDWIMNVMQTDAAINPGNSGGPLCNVNGEVIGVNSMKIVESEIEGIGFAIPIEDAITYAKQIVNGEKIKRTYLGIKMGNVGSSVTSGVKVYSIVSDGPCDKAGIIEGDIIIKIGDYDVENVAQLRYYLFKYKPNDIVNINVKRGNDIKTFKVTLGESE